MPPHPLLCLGGATYKVVPSLDDASVLGFRLEADEESLMPVDASTAPLPGRCVLHSRAVHRAEARILGWRDVSAHGLMGFAMEFEDAQYAKYLGCIIVQDDCVVGVVQATHTDAWGYPMDLLLAAADRPRNFCEPLLLVPDYGSFFGGGEHADWPYSLALGRFVREPGSVVCCAS